MLSYLVGSKARRRVLTVLWASGAKGTATQLAHQARVSFPTAYRELRAMDRWGLVVSEESRDGVVYAARRDHPDADLMSRLVASKVGRVADDQALEVRAQLSAAGAPLRADRPKDPSPPFHEMVAKGVRLARRDPEVARALPVLFYQHRAEVENLVASPAVRPVGHPLGFFLAVTARLSGDKRMARLAAPLRDRRVRRQDLFQSAMYRGSSRRNFPLARAWGFRVGADLEWFEGLFEKFVSINAETRE